MPTVKIENKKGEVICQLDGVSADLTVAEFKDLAIKECDYISECALILTQTCLFREEKAWP